MKRKAAREIEIKLAVPSASAARRLLRAAKFRLSRPRIFESDTILDTPDLRLRKSGCLIRVRDTKNGAVLTFKGPATAVKYKSREELEAVVDDGSLLKTILGRLGFQPVFCYQKYRAEFRRDAGGIAMLDETPVGVFLELEGTPRWIDRTARQLGFAEADYITASYWQLYIDWCARHRRKPTHMIFRRTPDKR